MGNGWMSPLDQGKYASYLFFHGLLDKAQYQQLDEIGELLTLFIWLICTFNLHIEEKNIIANT